MNVDDAFFRPAPSPSRFDGSVHTERSKIGSASRGRTRYAQPRIFVLLTSTEILEALGPAQAAYGGTGMP